MLRVTVRGGGLPTVVLGSGESLWIGRAPESQLDELDAADQLRTAALALPRCAAHVSRVLGQIVVGEEIVKLRWTGQTEAQLSSLFDAPGGARRVTLAGSMSALLDEGANQVVILRGRESGSGAYEDLQLILDVAHSEPEEVVVRASTDHDATATAPAPRLEHHGREWFVALALAKPWLSGTDDYPRPPSNREIFEQVKAWHGYAWNLDRPQRVDDAIRAIARVAFGPRDDPFAAGGGRAQNVRFAIGRRAAETRLVTADDLNTVEIAARERNVPAPKTSPDGP